MRHFCGYRHRQVSTTTTSTWMTLKVSAIYLTFQTWTFLLHCLELWPLHNHPIYQPSVLIKLVHYLIDLRVNYHIQLWRLGVSGCFLFFALLTVNI